MVAYQALKNEKNKAGGGGSYPKSNPKLASETRKKHPPPLLKKIENKGEGMSVRQAKHRITQVPSHIHRSCGGSNSARGLYYYATAGQI